MQRQYVAPVVAKPALHQSSGPLDGVSTNVATDGPALDVVVDDLSLQGHVPGCTCPACLAYRRSLKAGIHSTVDGSSPYAYLAAPDPNAAPAKAAPAAPAAAVAALPPSAPVDQHSILNDVKVVAALSSFAPPPHVNAIPAHVFSEVSSVSAPVAGHEPAMLGGLGEHLHF